MNICINNLSVTYGDADIIKDISINLQNVYSLGIIGESGCGKSTLLRNLAGIENAQNGSILIDDLSPILNKIEFQSQIGYVFQKHNLFPHLSVYKNIHLILKRIKKLDESEIKNKIDEVLKILRIEDIKDKKPSKISGGQAQRASIARALATEPKYMFLDEPTAALDPVLTNEVLKAITDLKESGRNFVFVTHEISFLKEFADYIIFLKDGKICEHGNVDCLQNPATKELADFLRIN